jgi:hypothetical protein
MLVTAVDAGRCVDVGNNGQTIAIRKRRDHRRVAAGAALALDSGVRPVVRATMRKSPSRIQKAGREPSDVAGNSPVG